MSILFLKACDNRRKRAQNKIATGQEWVFKKWTLTSFDSFVSAK